MKRYIVQHDYQSHEATWKAGQVVEIDDDDLAAWFNRDSRGVLKELVSAPTPATAPEPPVETRALEAPPHDRMMRKRKVRNEG